MRGLKLDRQIAVDLKPDADFNQNWRCPGHDGSVLRLALPRTATLLGYSERDALQEAPFTAAAFPAAWRYWRRCAPGLVLVNSISPVEQIDFHFEAVRVKPPVSHTAAALVPTFCSLYGTFGAPCATDHNALLEALV
jgi:hypothetical protein